MSAKSFLLVSVAHCVLLITLGETSRFNDVNEKCREEFHLEQEEFMRLNKTRHLDTNDEKIKCFVKCLLTGLNVMNADGEFTAEENVVGNMKYKKHIPSCLNSTGTDLCEKAVNFQNCMWSHIDEEEKAGK